MTARPWICRLYPERGSSLYARVQVWPTKRAFLAHVNEIHRSINGRGFGRHCDGTCSRHEVWSFKTGKARRHRCFAVVNMWRGRLTMRVVTHELFHATMAWGYRVKFPFAGLATDVGVTADEERITYVHGELCRQFMVRASAPGAPYDVRGKVRSH